jgi:microcystin-dependent protein
VPVYSVILRDATYTRIDELADWLSFSYVKRFNGVGTWELEVSNLSVSATLIEKTSGIIVQRDDETIFSGSVATEYTRTATTLRVAGYDDMVLLDVPMLPTPSGPPYTTEYDVRTAGASSVLIQLVQFNVSPVGARPNRVIPQLIFAPNPILGGTVTSRGRFQSMLAYMADLASTPSAGGLGFELQQTQGDDTLTFRVFQPEDRRQDATFSIESLTAQDFEDVYRHPPYNKVYVLLGDGLGGNRSVIEAEDTASVAEVGRRIEMVIDARDVGDPGEGNQRAAEALAGAVSSRRVTVAPFQLNTLEFGADYDLGDLVRFVIDDVVYDEVIREVHVDFTLDRGVVVTPSIGSGADPDDDAAVHRQIQAVDLRLTNIERNYTVPDNSVMRDMLVPVLKPPIGEVAWLAHQVVPAGWLAANGQAVSRATYNALFALLSTAWGAGNGTTTFNVPDLRNRSPIGSGATYPTGALVGATTATIADHQHGGAPHTHPGSHSHGLGLHTHVSQPHTHPGTHRHAIALHTHDFDHNHDIDIGPFNSAYTNVDSVAVGHASLGSGATDHKHSVDIPRSTTESPDHIPTGNANPSLTQTGLDSDTGGFAAAYSGVPGAPSPNSSDGDTNVFAAAYTAASGSAGAATISTVHPSAGLYAVIYAGV